MSSSGSGAEAGFELPRELERTLHENVLRAAREHQRTAFRPGVTSTGKAVDVLLQERSAKKIAKALRALQDDYGFDARDAAQQRMVREALQYTNKLEDALQFLALQYSSDELPSSLRATPTGAGLTPARSGDDGDDGELTVALHAKPLDSDVDAAGVDAVTRASSEAVVSQAAVVADSWEDDLVDDDGKDVATETAAAETAAPNSSAATASDADASVNVPSASDTHARSWTQQYLEVIAQREAEEARLAAEFAKLSPEEKYVLELEAQFKHVLALVQHAKAEKATKKKQKAVAQELQLLRQRLVERGWSEQEFYARERKTTGDGGDDIDGDGEGELSQKAKRSRRRKQQSQLQQDEATAAEATAPLDPDATAVVDDESGGASLFDDAPSGSSSSASAPAPVVAVTGVTMTVASSDSSVPFTHSSSSKSKRGKQQQQASASTSWTGKSPRDHIQDHCKKHKLPQPVYRKLATRGRTHLYALVIDFKSHKREFVVPADGGGGGAMGFSTIDEAKDTVATHALFAINPALPLYRVLPPTYRDLWLAWVREQEREAADAVSISRAGFDAVVSDIVASIPDEVRAKVSTVAMPDSASAAVDSGTAGRRPTGKTMTANKVGGDGDVQSEDDEDDEAGATASASKLLDDWALDDWDADLSDSEATEQPADDWEQECGDSEVVATSASPVAVVEPEDPAARVYSQELKARLLASMRSKAYKALWTRRQDLPITSFKDTVLAALEAHDVVLISGETGCGKSTQVPQFLLEHALLTQERGATCQIVCTQPRRLAAISLADRVSQELGEPAMGAGDSLCGFQIRLENRMTRHTRLVFCTTGILLRRLQDPATLARDVSHIIVDEVHERDLQSDVLLAMLRQFLAGANRARATPLKVVLMSATLNAASFQQYFGGVRACPMLLVPGRTFPVQPYFLEDVLELTEYTIDDTHPAYVRYESMQQSTHITVSGRGGTSYAQKVYWDVAPTPASRRAAPPSGAVVSGSDNTTYSERTLKTLACIDASVINYELIQELLERLVAESELLILSDARPSASVLVFLPGLHEISTLLDLLGAHRLFADDRRFSLLPLHSSLAPQDQQRIFAMPRGIVRIIATTNIAETSLTVEDVKVVIDSGRVKEMRHNSAQRTNVLDEIWVARANAQQRMGRAGRTSGGVCYRLFPRAIFTGTMDEQPVPEIKRAPLTSLCLQIKTFGVDDVSCSEFLGACLDPPSAASVRDALHELVEIGALERTSESLTTLGCNLAKLPVDVKVGKMLLLGALFGVFDAIATSAAILETKSPFVAPYGHQSEMQAARKRFAVAQSDLLTDVNAFETWRARFQRTRNSGRGAEREFCREHYLSQRALLEITKLKQQFYTLVAQAGYLPRTASSSHQHQQHQTGDCELLSREQTALVAAILFAGLAPNLVHVERAAASDASKKRVVLRDQDHTVVAVHPSSINHKNNAALASAFLTYAVKLHTSQVYLPTSSLVLPAAVCLFSHSLEVLPHARGAASGAASGAGGAAAGVAVRVNDWVVFHSSFRSAIVLQELRRMVAAFVARSLEAPLFHGDSGAGSRQPKHQQQVAPDNAVQLKQALRSLLASELDLHDPKHALTKQLSSERKEPLA